MSIPANSLDIYNRELIFDLNLDAFYMYDIHHSTEENPDLPRVNDYIPIPSFVQIEDPDDPMSYIRMRRTVNSRVENFKFLCTGLGHISIAEYRDEGFKDWRSIDGNGLNYVSYLISGPLTLNEFALNKQSNYLSCFFWRTETHFVEGEDSEIQLQIPSSCIVQGLWDWHGAGGNWTKWTKEFQAYRLLRPMPQNPSDGDILPYPEALIITKNKLRGRGRSLMLYFRAEEGKDMRLLGWHLPMTQVDVV